MREQGRRVDERVRAVDRHRFPPPRTPALRGQGVHRRPDAEQVQPEQLAVTVPAIGEKPRRRPPAMRERPAAIERPDPVDPRINPVHQRTHLRIVEVFPREERPLKKQRRVDRRRLAAPHPRSGMDVNKVINPPMFLGHGPVDRTKQGQRVLRRRFPVDPAAVDADAPGGQRKPRGCDAGRRAAWRTVGWRPIAGQARCGIRMIAEIAERPPLNLVQEGAVTAHCEARTRRRRGKHQQPGKHRTAPAQRHP